MLKKLLLIGLVLIAAALFHVGTYLSGALSAASGFAAKNLCSGHFISGMSGQTIMDEALLPVATSFSWVEYDIDEQNQHVDASTFNIAKRRAVFSEATGCTLLKAGETELKRRPVPVVTAALDPQTPWPQGSEEVDTPATLEPLLDNTFAEPGGEELRHTKAVVIVHNGKLLAEKYAVGIDRSTPLIGWSMTKSITNLLVGILVHDGKLALEQPAPVPRWRQTEDDPRTGITVDQLLRMSSGLEFDESYSLYTDVTRMLSVEADAAGFAASMPAEFAPDSHWSYSSGTSNLLNGIIRRTIGGEFQDYYAFTQRRLFLPLGAHSAKMETDYNGTFIGSSYMYATARDWARLGQLCLQDGVWQGKRLLPEGWMQYSTTPTATNPRNNYGAHFWLNADPGPGLGSRRWPAIPADAYSMDGFQGQRVIIVPSKDLVIVRMGFSATSDRGIEELIAGVIAVLDTSTI